MVFRFRYPLLFYQSLLEKEEDLITNLGKTQCLLRSYPLNPVNSYIGNRFFTRIFNKINVLQGDPFLH